MFKRIFCFSVLGLFVLMMSCAPSAVPPNARYMEMLEQQKRTEIAKARIKQQLSPIPIPSNSYVSGISLGDGCKGPFGVDSQQILNGDWRSPGYSIEVVGDIDLEKNNDGTWYVHACKLPSKANTTVYFAPPYPQQNDLEEGDFIGFKGNYNETLYGLQVVSSVYKSVKILDHISSQSVNCKIRGLPVPSATIPLSSTIDDFVSVTGVVMAVETRKNSDPEPDDLSDYHIVTAVMKFANDRLYLVDFHDSITISPSKYDFRSENLYKNTRAAANPPSERGDDAADRLP